MSNTSGGSIGKQVIRHLTVDIIVVWITRWRNDAIGGEFQKDLENKLKELCAKMYVNVISMGMEEDHVHMYISIPPSKGIPYVVNRLKGVTSRELMERHREYLRRWYWSEEATLRARGYFICTVGEMTSDIVKRYIESQGQEENLGAEVEL